MLEGEKKKLRRRSLHESTRLCCAAVRFIFIFIIFYISIIGTLCVLDSVVGVCVCVRPLMWDHFGWLGKECWADCTGCLERARLSVRVDDYALKTNRQKERKKEEDDATSHIALLYLCVCTCVVVSLSGSDDVYDYLFLALLALLSRLKRRYVCIHIRNAERRIQTTQLH